MRRVTIKTVEDLMALPEGEWVHIPGGIRAEFVDDDVKVEKGRLLITLPKRAAKKFKLTGGEKLQAKYSRGRLVVERP